MPMLLEHIDQIARAKQRDALFVTFRPPAGTPRVKRSDDDDGLSFGIDWEKLPIRQQIIDWLEAKGIAWQPCGYKANVNCMGSYEGQIYIDVPYDVDNPTYRELSEFLETPEGTSRFPDAWFYVEPLASAMENAHHDEPGFWDRWAENF